MVLILAGPPRITHDRALAYLRDNTALAEHEITTEIDRYIASPGQARSYYLGVVAGGCFVGRISTASSQ